MKKWSEKEINFLKKNYLKYSLKGLANILNRSFNSTKNKLNRLGINKGSLFCKGGLIKWTEKEKQVLLKYTNISIKEIAKKLNKSEHQIRYAIRKFKIEKKDPFYWSDKELELLKNNVNKDYSILKKFFPNRSMEAIIGKKDKLRLKRKNKLCWSNEADEYLIKNYHKKSISELAEELKKSYGSIHARRIRLIKKGYLIKNKKKFFSKYWKEQYRTNKKLVEKHIKSLVFLNPSRQQLYAIGYLRKLLGKKVVGCNDWDILGSREIDIPLYKFKIAIEWDGEYYHYKRKGAQEKDKEKNKFIIENGWKFIRVKDDGLSKKEIENRCELILTIIERYKNSDEYQYTGGFYI